MTLEELDEEYSRVMKEKKNLKTRVTKLEKQARKMKEVKDLEKLRKNLQDIFDDATDPAKNALRVLTNVSCDECLYGYQKRCIYVERLGSAKNLRFKLNNMDLSFPCPGTGCFHWKARMLAV